jgi:hypothetical protein
MIKIGRRQGATATTRNHKSMNRTKSFIKLYTFGESDGTSGCHDFRGSGARATSSLNANPSAFGNVAPVVCLNPAKELEGIVVGCLRARKEPAANCLDEWSAGHLSRRIDGTLAPKAARGLAKAR